MNRPRRVLRGADKVLHTLSFLGLSLFIQRAARRWSASSVGAAAVAVTDELTQAFQPARHFDMANLAASLAGIGLGLGWAHRQRSKTRAALLIAAALRASVGVTTAPYVDQRHLERALRAEPDMFCIHYHLCEVYLALGLTDKTLVHLRRQTERTETREAARAAKTLAVLSQGG